MVDFAPTAFDRLAESATNFINTATEVTKTLPVFGNAGICADSLYTAIQQAVQVLTFLGSKSMRLSKSTVYTGNIISGNICNYLVSL